MARSTIIIGGCLLTMSCGPKGAEKLVADYLKEANCANRANHVLEPERHRAALAAQQGVRPVCTTKHGRIDASQCEGTTIGDYCNVSVQGGPGELCVKRTTATEYKIDWLCSTGWNATPLSVFKLKRPGPNEPVLMRVTAQLSDYYPPGIERGYELSLRLADQNESEAFFMPHKRRPATAKKDLVFESAEKLRQLLSDGKKHKVTVEVAYLERNKRPLPFVGWLFQEGWQTISGADQAAAQEEKKRAMLRWGSPGKQTADRLKECCGALDRVGFDKDSPEPIGSSLRARSKKCFATEFEIRRGDQAPKSAVELASRYQALFREFDAADRYPAACRRLTKD